MIVCDIINVMFLMFLIIVSLKYMYMYTELNLKVQTIKNLIRDLLDVHQSFFCTRIALSS